MYHTVPSNENSRATPKARKNFYSAYRYMPISKARRPDVVNRDGITVDRVSSFWRQENERNELKEVKILIKFLV